MANKRPKILSPIQRAFAGPAPRGWRPQFGEKVLVDRIRGTMSALTAYGLFFGNTLDPDIVLVQLKYGTKCCTQQFCRSDIRPIQAKRKRVRKATQ